MFINELKKEFEEISVLFVVSLEPSVLFQDILNKKLSIYYLNVSLSIFILQCQRAEEFSLYTQEQVFLPSKVGTIFRPEICVREAPSWSDPLLGMKLHLGLLQVQLLTNVKSNTI